jgi:biotin operon repressor
MMGDWTFFSNHGHVLVCLARDSRARLRDVAADVGITERAVQKIVKDLQAEGFITVRKQGRCNRYRINRRKTLRHALVSQCTVGKLLALVAAGRSEPRYVVEDEPVSEQAVVTPDSPRPEESGMEPAPKTAGTTGEPESTMQSSPAAPYEEPATRDTPAAKAETKPEPKSKRKSKPEDAPLDVEQQGSLF